MEYKSPSKSAEHRQNKRPLSRDGASIITLSKRVASGQYDINCLSTQSYALQHNDPSSKNHANTANESFQHHIKQTFLGPICTVCNQKIANNNILFIASRNSLKSHLTTNQCYTGNIAYFKSRELEMSLRTSILEYYRPSKEPKKQSQKTVEGNLHPLTPSNSLPYCSRCGFVGSKLFNVSRHYKSQANSCSESDVRLAGGKIKTNKYGFLVPDEVLDKISNGSFIFPNNNNSPRQSVNKTKQILSALPIVDSDIQNNDTLTPQDAPHTFVLSTDNTSIVPSLSTTSTQCTRFLPSDAEIMSVISDNSPYNDAVSHNSFVLDELVSTFGEKEKADIAYEYLTFFILLIDQQMPGKLKSLLTNYTTMMKSSQNHPILQLLLVSGKKWLQSNAANLDVRMVPVHHRNAIYRVGNSFLESDKDLLKGSTFVWSENVDAINEQFQSLITFAYEIKWPTIIPYIDKAKDVFTVVKEHPDFDEEDEYTLASNKLINTNIIFALLTEILLESPSTPNGPNLVYRYLAGATVRRTHNNDIVIRNHNEISKHANALLRLLRHGLCSFYIRQSQLMAQRNSTHDDFETWANKLIEETQVSLSLGHICRTIRTAREMDRKTPSKLQKAFNDKTGELFVSGVTIHKSTWSIAIPTAIAEWDKSIHFLFPNHSPESSLPLIWLFDLKNDFILAGNDSYISVGSNPSHKIPLQGFHPTFSQ